MNDGDVGKNVVRIITEIHAGTRPRKCQPNRSTFIPKAQMPIPPLGQPTPETGWAPRDRPTHLAHNIPN